jgi:glycosyltransferase involved in cell wall biosynthesis
VVIPLFNYAATILEALESVLAQTLPLLDLIVIDDASTDESRHLVQDWLARHAGRFNRTVLLRNTRNAGLGPTRNAGFDAAETPFVLLLDADNRLRPGCAAACLAALSEPGGDAGAAFAYPMIQCFGDSTEVIGTRPFLAARLVGGNYIDAMALVARWAWAAVGGYRDQRLGWEDYELWCRMAEAGVQVPEVLAEYRVHARSMLHEVTERPGNRQRLAEDLATEHPWLALLFQCSQRTND